MRCDVKCGQTGWQQRNERADDCEEDEFGGQDKIQFSSVQTSSGRDAHLRLRDWREAFTNINKIRHGCDRKTESPTEPHRAHV